MIEMNKYYDLVHIFREFFLFISCLLFQIFETMRLEISLKLGVHTGIQNNS